MVRGYFVNLADDSKGGPKLLRHYMGVDWRSQRECLGRVGQDCGVRLLLVI